MRMGDGGGKGGIFSRGTQNFMKSDLSQGEMGRMDGPKRKTPFAYSITVARPSVLIASGCPHVVSRNKAGLSWACWVETGVAQWSHLKIHGNCNF